MITKKCTKCLIEKSVEEFSKDKDLKSGLRSSCKLCDKKKNAKFYQKNKEELKIKARNWRQSNSKYHKESCEKWRMENKEHVKEYRKKYRKKHEKRIKEYSAKWSRENKEKVTNRLVKRYHNDLNFKIKCVLRSRIKDAIKNMRKSEKVIDLLGCSIEEVRIHLELQFKKGMNWDNHGRNGWHIDHIRPCKSFDLTDPEQRKQCFHYTNLQPLWEPDNLSKGSKWQNTT